VVNGGVQLEAVMSALVVLAKGSYVFGDFVPVGPDESAYGQHGTVHKAQRGCRRAITKTVPGVFGGGGPQSSGTWVAWENNPGTPERFSRTLPVDSGEARSGYPR